MKELSNTTVQQPEKEETLYLRREIHECIIAAWTLLTTNFKRICKTIALPALVLGALVALLVPTIMEMPLAIAQGTTSEPDMKTMQITTFAFIVLLTPAFLYFYASLFKLLNGKSVKFNIVRIIKVWLATIPIAIYVMVMSLVVVFMLPAIGEPGKIALSYLLMLIGWLPLVPIGYTYMKYIVETDSKISILWKFYRAGAKRFWFILGTYILTGIVVYFASLVICIPLVIIVVAYSISMSGAIDGDPTGLPSTFTGILAATMFLYMIITSFFGVFSTFVMYYCYASVEVRNGRTEPEPDKEQLADETPAPEIEPKEQ